MSTARIPRSGFSTQRTTRESGWTVRNDCLREGARRHRGPLSTAQSSEFPEHEEPVVVGVGIRDVLEPEQVPLAVAVEEGAARGRQVDREEGVAPRVVVEGWCLGGLAEVHQTDVVLPEERADADIPDRQPLVRKVVVVAAA